MGDRFTHVDKITAGVVRNELAIRKTRAKYGANRTTTADGIPHDSKREAKRWTELQILQQTGHISDLRRQVPFGLEGRDGPIMTDSGKKQRSYVADFHYFDRRNGVWVIEDAKGFPTKEYKLKRAIMAAQGVEVIEV